MIADNFFLFELNFWIQTCIFSLFLFCNGEIKLTDLLKRASYEMVVNWVNDVWQQVAADGSILKGFK